MKRFGKLALLGTVISLIGVYILHHDKLNLAHSDLPGVIAACLAPLLWAIGSLVSRKYMTETDALSSTAIQMLSSSLILIALSAAIGESWQVQLTTRVVVAMTFLILIGSVIVYGVYIWILRKMPASRVTTYTYINPLVALILGSLILHEQIPTEAYLATVLIFGGLVLTYFFQIQKRLQPSNV